MPTAKAQAVQLLGSREVTPGTAPTTLWRTFQPNPGGIQGFAGQYVDVARNVLNPNFTDEKGDHVGENANWTLGHDLTKDLVDYIGPGLLRSAPKAPWGQGILYPTAAVDGGGSADSFAVTGAATLPAGTIIRTRGFKNAANNGWFVLTSGSSGTALNVATGTLVAETVAVAGSASVEVVGFQFTSGDGQIDGSGDFIATTQDLTVFQLQDNTPIMFGGIAAGTRFSGTATYNGVAFVNGTITSTKIPLKWRSWTIGSADTASGKTIQIFFPTLMRNVAQGHTDFIDEPVFHFEKKDTGVGTAGADVFNYGERMGIGSIGLTINVEQKIEASINFVGARITEPVLAASRKTGPSTATPPLATELFDTTASTKGGDTALFRIVRGDDFSALVAKVNSATLTIDHGADVQKQVGQEDGPVNFGKIRPSATMDTFYEKYEVPLAIKNNTTVRLEGLFINDSAGVMIVFPNGVLSGGQPTYGEDAPVMMGVDFKAHRDPDSNIVALFAVFPYLPRKTVTAV